MPALFTQLEIGDRWNALTAGSFDASTSFDANTPLSHVAYSLGALGGYYSPQANARPNAVFINAQDSGAQADCEPWNIGCQIVKALSSDPVKDGLKRTGLFVLAIVLLALALWKL